MRKEEERWERTRDWRDRKTREEEETGNEEERQEIGRAHV